MRRGSTFLTFLSMCLPLAACGVGRSNLFNDRADGGSGARTPDPQPAPQTTPDPGPAADAPVGSTSYMPVNSTEPFDAIRARLVGEKPAVLARQATLLGERYDLADRSEGGLTMTRGKPIQTGIRVKTKAGMTWDQLSALTPLEIRQKDLFPPGFLPLPHVKHQEGGMVFPQFQIDEIRKQEARDIARFDVDFDIPIHFLPEFPAPMFLTSRPDLGDVSKGEEVSSRNFFRLFNGILTPKQLDGIRLLTLPFAQQQFNLTDDRRVDTAQEGVACFDCHANGHTNGAFHLDPVTRPQAARMRIETPTLRGVNIQRLFGSQRALKTVEDFTQFEQLAAYFDGDPVIGMKKGLNILNRDFQVAAMAEFQQLLDFPPAEKLDAEGRLYPGLATPQELRGEALFNGKADCVSCHAAPFFTDNEMHDLRAERFYEPRMINDMLASKDGLIKTFPLRGIKHSPPYLHDGRLLTLEDTVEFFNLVTERHLSTDEKADLVSFLRTL